ncbi:MAG: O-antigen ligase family protein, partial [Nitrospirota bacterium]|nr:O-antigen ligase family protein [Nitrospirota bacterium]
MDRWNQPDKKIIVISAAILIFAVLSFGAVEVWSSAIIEVSVFTLMIVWMIWGRTETHLQPVQEQKYMIIVIFGFLLYTLVQMIPFPAVLLKYLSPESYSIYSYYTTDKDPAMAISIYPYKTGVEFLRMLTYVLFFVILSYSIHDRSTLTKMMKILVFFGFVLALFSLLQTATWNGKLYWLREIPVGGRPFGPFVCRNHYAGFINMIIPLSLGLALTKKSKEKQILFGFFGLIMSVSLFFSLSRGGIISFLTGIVVFTFLLSWNKLRAKKVWVLVFFAFIVFLYVLYLGIDPLIDRFYKTDVTGEERFVVWSITFNAFKDFFLTGSGIGTFIHMFPFYASEYFYLIYDHAHNDYLEFLLEAGLIGTSLLLIFVLFFIRSMVRSRWDGHIGIFKIALISSIITMAVHSFFDFNLH